MEHGGIRGRIRGVIGGHSDEKSWRRADLLLVSRVTHSVTVSLCSVSNLGSQERDWLTTNGPEGVCYGRRSARSLGLLIKSESYRILGRCCLVRYS